MACASGICSWSPRAATQLSTGLFTVPVFVIVCGCEGPTMPWACHPLASVAWACHSCVWVRKCRSDGMGAAQLGLRCNTWQKLPPAPYGLMWCKTRLPSLGRAGGTNIHTAKGLPSNHRHPHLQHTVLWAGKPAIALHHSAQSHRRHSAAAVSGATTAPAAGARRLPTRFAGGLVTSTIPWLLNLTRNPQGVWS